MIIFVLTSAKIEPDVRIFTFSLSYFGKSENIFILHQKMRETSQKIREMVDESTENEKRETFYLALSMIAYLHKTIEEAPLLPQDVVNKKKRKLLIFFLSLSLSAQPPCSLGAVEKLLSLTLSIVHIPLSLFFVHGH